MRRNASPSANDSPALNRVHRGDCLDLLARMPDASVHLAFADPPFNIGYDYDSYDDRLAADVYLKWSKQWMGEVGRVLRSDGTFWLAIGDEYAAELKVTATRELGFTCRSWVVWYYTFGVHCKYKFARSHAHLFQFVKNPEAFTFNTDAVRVPSARELVYGDKRASPTGRLPDDTWILRPQDLPEGFAADGDTWYFPRVCGTFKERSGWHGCQMPEQLLGRIIRASSHEDDVVLDPFGGSGTTLAVAKKLGRCFIGLELSEHYAKRIDDRLAAISSGDPLDGAPEPLKSVPATKDGRRLASKTRGARKKATRKKTAAGPRIVVQKGRVAR
jgi:site-specific DNA-methyltransferase (adenine-specific)